MSQEINPLQQNWFAQEGEDALRRLGFVPGQRVVDFGCGPGRFSIPLSRIVSDDKAGQVIAVDHSADAIETLQARLEQWGDPSCVRPVLLSAGQGIEAVGADAVDAVLAFDVLQHVDDQDAFFSGVHQCLAPGGSLWVYPAAVPHPGMVNMDDIRSALASHGFEPAGEYRLRLAHASEMLDDVVYRFTRL